VKEQEWVRGELRPSSITNSNFGTRQLLACVQNQIQPTHPLCACDANRDNDVWGTKVKAKPNHAKPPPNLQG
jgi:hypothetical protein